MSRVPTTNYCDWFRVLSVLFFERDVMLMWELPSSDSLYKDKMSEYFRKYIKKEHYPTPP